MVGKKTFRIALVLVMVMAIGLSAYAKTGLMAKADQPLVTPPDKAVIVFMRSTIVASAVRAVVFDVTGETRFIGFSYNATKLAYTVDPGEYTFMVTSEAADFMKASVEAGKTYYVLITPRMGVIKARFSFRPLRQADFDSKDFAKWDSKTELVENTSDSEAWASENVKETEDKRVRYWPDWTNSSPEEQDSTTLKPEDGR